MAERRKSSGIRKAYKYGKPMRKANKKIKKARAYYVKHRAKILKYAKKYYRTHRAKVLKKAKKYRMMKKKGMTPFYKKNKAGGRYPRGKRFKRVGKYTRVGGKRASRKA